MCMVLCPSAALEWISCEPAQFTAATCRCMVHYTTSLLMDARFDSQMHDAEPHSKITVNCD